MGWVLTGQNGQLQAWKRSSGNGKGLNAAGDACAAPRWGSCSHHGAGYFLIHFNCSLLGASAGARSEDGASVSPSQHYFPFSTCNLSLLVSVLPACSRLCLHGAHFISAPIFLHLQARDLFSCFLLLFEQISSFLQSFSGQGRCCGDGSTELMGLTLGSPQRDPLASGGSLSFLWLLGQHRAGGICMCLGCSLTALGGFGNKAEMEEKPKIAL